MATSIDGERRVLPAWAANTWKGIARKGTAWRGKAWVVDTALVATVAVAMTLVINAAREDDATRSPGLFAYSLGFAVAALLFLRRYWPMAALVATVGLLHVYFALNYPAFLTAIPLAAATYAAVIAGRTGWVVVVLGVVMFGGLSWQTVAEGEPLLDVLGSGTLNDAVLLAAVVLLGEAVRNRRAWAEEVRLRLNRAAEDQEREAARRVEHERLRIARDLHDVMAHTIAAINVQAGMAADVIHDAPDEAASALRAIRKEAREAVAELKATVGVLRGERDTAPRSPAPGLDRLNSLIGTAAAGGLRVQKRIRGSARPLPNAVELTAYRILQESLTNVVRHAHATTATFTLSYEPDAVVVEVVDDGDGEIDKPGEADGNTASGFGLIGMRERVAALGGELETGFAPGGGFRVYARLPSWEADA